MTQENNFTAEELAELRKLLKAAKSKRVKAAQEAAARLTLRLRKGATSS